MIAVVAKCVQPCICIGEYQVDEGRTEPRVADHGKMRTRVDLLGKMQPQFPRWENARWKLRISVKDL